MVDISKLKNLANEAAEVATVNMAEESTGGGASEPWPVGTYRGRVIEVVEFGKQPQAYQGQAKPPAREVRIGVMLFPNKRVKDALGPDVAPKIVRSLNFKIGNNGKSGAKSLFDKLNVEGTYTNFAQTIGDAYKFKLKDHTGSSGKTSQIIDWAMTQPAVDDETGKALPVPDAPEEAYTLFLFDKPTLEMWDKLYIEGRNDQGKSKNFIQEQIIAALDFAGSPLEQLLKTGGKSLPEPAGAVDNSPAPEKDEPEDEGDDLPPPPPGDDEY